jgi:hypothetical protein
VIAIISACSSTRHRDLSNAKFVAVKDRADKVLKGNLNGRDIESDTAFKWFAEKM